MKFAIRMMVCLVVTFLIACGGGGGVGSGGGSSSAEYFENKSNVNFVDTKNSFQDLYKKYASVVSDAENMGLIGLKSRASINRVISIDFNKDGKKELVVIFSTEQKYNGQTALEDVYSQIVVLELNDLGEWVDKTENFIEGPPVIRSQPGGALVADINNDNIPDMVLSAHQEDYRNPETSNMAAWPIIIISQKSSKHLIKKFGEKVWNLDVPRLLFSETKVSSVVVNQAGNIKAFVHENGTLVESGMQLSGLYNGVFENVVDDVASGNYILTIDSNGYDALLFRLQGGVLFEKIDKKLSPFSVVGSIQVSSADNVQRNVSVISDGENYFTGPDYAGYRVSASCGIKLTPTANKSVVMIADMLRIPNYSVNQSITLNQSEVENWKEMFWFRVEEGRIIETKINLKGWVGNFSAWNIHCVDIDGDGYEDIWFEVLNYVDSNQQKLTPLIFINDRNGGFSRVGDEKFPARSDFTGAALMGVLVDDFDGDGVFDYFSFPSLLWNYGDEKNLFKYYKGVNK